MRSAVFTIVAVLVLFVLAFFVTLYTGIYFHEPVLHSFTITFGLASVAGVLLSLTALLRTKRLPYVLAALFSGAVGILYWIWFTRFPWVNSDHAG